MWFIGVEVEQETSAPPPKKNPGSAPETPCVTVPFLLCFTLYLSAISRYKSLGAYIQGADLTEGALH